MDRMPSTVTIKPGALGADYVTTTPGILSWLKANKAQFVIRYIARSTSIGKIVTPAEVKLLHDNGIAVGLIYEQGTADHEKGAVKGDLDGRFAVEFAIKLGYPKGLVISAAADTDIPGQRDIDAEKDPDKKETLIRRRAATVAYMEAFKLAVTRSGYKFGMYADTDLGALVSCDLLCIPGARYWSKNDQYPRTLPEYEASKPRRFPIHMVQRIVKDLNVDPLDSFEPFDAWLVFPEPPKPPVKPHRVLKKRSVGNDVRELQKFLKVSPATGFFWTQTDRAVRAFQKANGLFVDGVVGPKTWAVIDAQSGA